MDELDRGIADQSQSVNRTSPIYHSSEPRDQEIPTFRQQMFMQTPHESLLQQCKNLICGNSTRPDVKKSRMVPYIKLFKYADRYDILLMVLGSIAAIVDGFTLPAMLCVQSHAINAFGVHRNDPVALAHNVSQVVSALDKAFLMTQYVNGIPQTEPESQSSTTVF